MIRLISNIALLLVVLGVVGCASTVTRHPDFGRDCASFEANVDCVRVYYGTNRAVVAADPEPGSFASDERDIVSVDNKGDNVLALGRADVWLPKLIEAGGTRELGDTPMIKGKAPKDRAEQEKYVFVTRITTSGKEHFVSAVKSAVDSSNSDSVLLFVHGFNVKFEDALIRSAQLAVDLNATTGFNPGVPLLFSWPSRGKMSIGSYLHDRKQSKASVPFLRDFLDIITTDLTVTRINIVAHSMGNRVLIAALEDYASDYLKNHPEQNIEFRIVLAAADFDRELFHSVADAMVHLQPNVTIYTSDKDLALKFSRLLNQKIRLGETNINKPFIGNKDGYTTIDATDVATELFGIGHSYYSDNPFILNDIRCALSDTSVADRALATRNYADQPDGDEYFQTRPEETGGAPECSLQRQSYPVTAAVNVVTPREEDRSVEAPMTTERLESRSAPPPPAAVMMIRPMVITLYYGTADLEPLPQSQAQFLQVINEATDVSAGIGKFIIRAYTDTEGDADKNLELSQRRAQRVADKAILQGVDPAVIEVRFFGETNLAVATADNIREPRNRRVEVIIFPR